ncbi:uncharacterized protein LAJ45_00501 [Morchella importuna]|uniref:uncharacterized protein n=1 Tax=Morchella importuna TaxID=1174673 RepID=UPI001E8CE7EE|nr:uncharacterized protein LAJ45_00501 [Morchella importuna]KAH8155491.1 hypothetical protein LAJ45_00501 [Morchella importuna]
MLLPAAGRRLLCPVLVVLLGKKPQIGGQRWSHERHPALRSTLSGSRDIIALTAHSRFLNVTVEVVHVMRNRSGPTKGYRQFGNIN